MLVEQMDTALKIVAKILLHSTLHRNHLRIPTNKRACLDMGNVKVAKIFLSNLTSLETKTLKRRQIMGIHEQRLTAYICKIRLILSFESLLENWQRVCSISMLFFSMLNF